MDKLALIAEFLENRLGVTRDRVTPEAKLEELGVDSLVLLELLFEFEDKLGVKLPTDGFETPPTLGQLIIAVDKLAANR